MSETLLSPNPPARKASPGRSEAWWATVLAGLLFVFAILPFSRTLGQGFLNFDDDLFVEDEHVSHGFSWSGIAWAFTDGPVGEWYPLSMLSHMLDCQVFRSKPAGHHLTNLLLHAAAAVVLFLALWRMTGLLWPSTMAAALFAVHPLRVESVAWIAERRDVLSGLFFMLSLLAYAEYVRQPRSLPRYLVVMAMLSLGLMAKPMLVTLPFLLLLLDVWPLGGFDGWLTAACATVELPSDDAIARPNRAFPWRIIVEKLPLLALVLASAGITVHVQYQAANSLPFGERFANAVVSCVAYLAQLFMPMGMSVFYPFPETHRPVGLIAAAALLLMALTVAAIVWRRRCPYFFVGWFWYLGMLVPVLELVPVGAHARADRYTYLPQIGLYIALVWGAMQLGAAWPTRRWLFGTGATAVLAALAICTWRQTGFWQDSKTLWQHAVDCDPRNAMAHYMLGVALSKDGDKSAAAEFQQATATDGRQQNLYKRVRALSHVELGDLALEGNDADSALAHFRTATEFDPDQLAPHMRLGSLLAKRGDFAGSEAEYQRSIELAPGSATVLVNAAVALVRQGKRSEAIADLRRAVELDPKLLVARTNLARLLADDGQVDEAIAQFRRAIDSHPDVPFSYYQLASLLRKQGLSEEAEKQRQRGVQAGRRYAETQNRQGSKLLRQGKTAEAIAQFEAAIAAAPDNAQAHKNLADALVAQGKLEPAEMHYRRALAIDPNLAPARQSLERLTNH